MTIQMFAARVSSANEAEGRIQKTLSASSFVILAPFHLSPPAPLPKGSLISSFSHVAPKGACFLLKH
jgi:hypothetical protein